MSDLNKNIEQAEHRAMEMLWEDRLRQRMQQQDAQLKSRRFYWQITAAAASVALLIGAFFFMQAPGSDHVVAYVFDTSRSGMLRSSEGGSNDAMQPIVEAMSKGDYAIALKQISQTQLPDKAERLALMEIQCYYHLNRFPEAIARCQALLQQPDITNSTREDAEISLAALWVKHDNNNPALRPMLERIAADDNNPYKEKANVLLKAVPGR
jgi:hypothetical protein